MLKNRVYKILSGLTLVLLGIFNPDRHDQKSITFLKKDNQTVLTDVRLSVYNN